MSAFRSVADLLAHGFPFDFFVGRQDWHKTPHKLMFSNPMSQIQSVDAEETHLRCGGNHAQLPNTDVYVKVDVIDMLELE